MTEPNTGTTVVNEANPQPISTESSLSNWAGDYVTDMLGRGQALSNMPFESYGGAMTAGPTQNQTNAFSGIAGLTLPTDGYSSDVAMFDQAAADQYMNPYTQSVLQPQLEEMARQNAIQQVSDNAAFTKAGAYGGGRQAIMNAERNDNMARLQNQATQEGYQKAYNTAFDMFTSDQRRLEDSNQFGANFGLKELGAETDLYNNQLKAGEMERGITQEGLTSDYNLFKEERDFPYKQVQYAMGLLDGMPLATENTNYQQNSALQNYLTSAGGGAQLGGNVFDIISQLFGNDDVVLAGDGTYDPYNGEGSDDYIDF